MKGYKLLCLHFALAVSLGAEADAANLNGAIYRGSPSAGNKVPVATAVAGAEVYVRPRNGGNWAAPVITDYYGRFTFTNLVPGSYEARAFLGSTRLWDQIVAVPSTLPRIVIRDVTVVYFAKNGDPGTVESVCANLAFPYEIGTAQNNWATNILWFGDSVAIPDVKALAVGLVKAGITLRAIRRFTDGSGLKAKEIQVGASPQHLTGPILSANAINATTDWPRARP